MATEQMYEEESDQSFANSSPQSSVKEKEHSDTSSRTRPTITKIENEEESELSFANKSIQSSVNRKEIEQKSTSSSTGQKITEEAKNRKDPRSLHGYILYDVNGERELGKTLSKLHKHDNTDIPEVNKIPPASNQDTVGCVQKDAEIPSRNNEQHSMDIEQEGNGKKNPGLCKKIKKFIKFAMPLSFILAILMTIIVYTKQTDLSNTIAPKIEALKDDQKKDSGEINKTLSTAVNNLHQRIEDLQKVIDTTYRNLITFSNKALQDLGHVMRIYLVSNSEGGCGETCINVTSGACIDDCSKIPDGNYQSCSTCHGYVSCVNQHIYHMTCSAKDLIWDDSIKRCEWSSSTCNEKE